MAKPRFSGKRRRKSMSLYDQAFHFRLEPRSKEITAFLQETPEFKPVLLLFQNRKLVPKGEIEGVSRGAVTILIAKGILTEEKGGRLFKLTNAAIEALDKMQK